MTASSTATPGSPSQDPELRDTYESCAELLISRKVPLSLWEGMIDAGWLEDATEHGPGIAAAMRAQEARASL